MYMRAAIVSVLAGLLATAPMGAQQGTFKVSTNTVPLYATVMDAEKRLVPDLVEEDFEVYDNGKIQTITSFDNKPLPITVIVMPSKSPPKPMWSMPATFRMWSTWSATSAIVAVGAGFAVVHRATPLAIAAASAGASAVSLARAASCRVDQAATFGEMKPGTNATITTPPLAGSRRRISSGTFLGTSSIARADE